MQCFHIQFPVNSNASRDASRKDRDLVRFVVK